MRWENYALSKTEDLVMTTSIRPTTLFPRRQRRKKRKNQQKILKHILEYFEKKCTKMRTSQSGKLKHNLISLLLTVELVQSRSNLGICTCMQTKLTQEENSEQVCGFFFLSLHSPSSSTQLEETTSLQK